MLTANIVLTWTDVTVDSYQRISMTRWNVVLANPWPGQ